jgi:hypothetical protein
MRFTIGLLCAALAIGSTTAAAQSWTPEQQELWKLEELQWKMGAEKDLSWIPKMVHPRMSAWSNDMPSPSTYASLEKWDKYESGESTTLVHEIYPIAATITGNVAVMQYRYHSRARTRRRSTSRRAAAGPTC